jgi:hypothetical protein
VVSSGNPVAYGPPFHSFTYGGHLGGELMPKDSPRLERVTRHLVSNVFKVSAADRAVSGLQ